MSNIRFLAVMSLSATTIACSIGALPPPIDAATSEAEPGAPDLGVQADLGYGGTGGTGLGSGGAVAMDTAAGGGGISGTGGSSVAPGAGGGSGGIVIVGTGGAGTGGRSATGGTTISGTGGAGTGGATGVGGVTGAGGTGGVGTATGGAGSTGTSTGGTTGACNPNVLLLGDTSTDTNTGLQAALQAQGLNVTLIQGGVSTYAGTPPSTDFSVVVVAEGMSYLSGADMPAAGQSAIVNANAGGVGVVFTDPPGFVNHASYWAVLRTLTLLTFGSTNSQAVPAYTLNVEGHPIWAGLPATFTSTVTVGIQSGVLSNGGTAIASLVDTKGGLCTTAKPCVGVAVKDGVGRIVHDGTFFNLTAANWYADPNLIMLFSNSIKWAAHCL